VALVAAGPGPTRLNERSGLASRTPQARSWHHRAEMSESELPPPPPKPPEPNREAFVSSLPASKKDKKRKKKVSREPPRGRGRR